METKETAAEVRSTSESAKNTDSFAKKVVKSLVISEKVKTTVKLIKIWGWGPPIGVVLGFLIAAVLIYFGSLPNWVIPDKYKSLIIEQKPTGKPNQAEITEIQRPPQWLQPFIYFLDREADDLKTKGVINNYMICVVETKDLSPFNQFDWILSASANNYEVHGYGFKVGAQETFQHLNSIKDDPKSIRFSIGESTKKGERMLAILRVSWKENLTPGTCTEVLRSTVR